jgi:hypothetical protein
MLSYNITQLLVKFFNYFYLSAFLLNITANNYIYAQENLIQQYDNIKKISENLESNESDKTSESKSKPVNKPGNMFDRLFGRVCSVQFLVQQNANHNSAIISEIAVVYNQKTLEKFSSLTNQDWFSADSVIAKQLKNSSDVQILHFELTPDYENNSYLIDINSGAAGAFLFNRLYNNLNLPPITINPYKNLIISFYESGINYKQD